NATNENDNNNNNIPSIGRCEFVVGKVLKCENHQNADKMYVEEIDLGEATGPRTIASAVRLHVPINEVRDSLVIVFKNLKPTDLRGVMSNGMIFAASNSDKSKIELIRPPKDCSIGERIILENDDLTRYTPDSEIDLKPKKRKDRLHGMMLFLF
ncbi:endothelial monocyte-activating polypeptide II precursor pro-EMAP II family protein, partial [Reticulomyxa filosa]